MGKIRRNDEEILSNQCYFRGLDEISHQNLIYDSNERYYPVLHLTYSWDTNEAIDIKATCKTAAQKIKFYIEKLNFMLHSSLGHGPIGLYEDAALGIAFPHYKNKMKTNDQHF